MTALTTRPTAATATRTAAAAVDAVKTYGKGDAAVHALAGVTINFGAGQFTATMGPSGSGKSTLMHALAGLDTLTSGQVCIGDTDITGMKEKQLTVLRREKIGFVFQSFNLVPTLTAIGEHHAAAVARRPEGRPRRGSTSVVTTVGLGNRLKHKPSELSGGQQQRVAVARTLVSPARDRLRRRADRATSTRTRAPRSSSSCAGGRTSSARRS